MKQMKHELLTALADMIGKAIRAGDEKTISELSAWESFVQFDATTTMIASFYCEMHSTAQDDSTTDDQPVAVSPAQLSMF